MINSITKPVDLSLKLLWSHEQGDMCNEQIDAAATVPAFSLVDADGGAIDVKAADYDAGDVYGVHFGDGQVYWAHSVFNDLYINWPAEMTAEQKVAIVAQLKKTFLIIKSS